MESPPSSTTWSEAFILSDDSGLLLTNGSVSSGSTEAPRIPIEDSDCEERSLSQYSLDAMSDIICGENFNTLKKTPLDHIPATSLSPIEPPLAFQDSPPPLPPLLHSFSFKMASILLSQALEEYQSILINRTRWRRDQWCIGRCCGHEFAGYSSPISSGRPGSRSSLSSRFSSSHNSLYVPSARRVDDSSFITQAVSHDTLSTNQISDLYTVPFDSDVYAVPIDVVKEKHSFDERSSGVKRSVLHGKRKKRKEKEEGRGWRRSGGGGIKADKYHWCLQKPGKRHSLACSAPNGVRTESEPVHMTLQEVRHYLQTLYSSSSDLSEQSHYNNNNNNNKNTYCRTTRTNKSIGKPQKVVQATSNEKNSDEMGVVSNGMGRGKKGTFLISIKNKKIKDSCESKVEVVKDKRKKSPARFLAFKQTLCNMFRFRRFMSPERVKIETNEQGIIGGEEDGRNTIVGRALPPLPNSKEEKPDEGEPMTDFATSIQRVKDYGWYWGPLPSEVAEKILSNEPDGSFIVRDSSDDHYIFSLTFKLNNCVRHVRIEHDQGNFSFGSCTKFKSQTIVEFIENAVEHSRSGRYLFFLHRRPVIGPVRVQLLHPVSRFKQVQSLQHICRFAIHKVVRRDLIPSLPLPRRMIDYLNTPHYYSEHLVDVVEAGEPPPCSAFRREDPDVPVAPLNYIVLNETHPRQS